jgi:hypothetical protein
MTNINEPERLPRSVDALIAKHHRGGVTAQDCRQCSSACCSQGGFALLENVLRIYQDYRNNQLRRTDFTFECGLPFRDFVHKYFDVYLQITGKWWWKRSVLLFHMRSLSSDDNVVSIPAVGEFYGTRHQLFSANPWLNKGCVFLSRKVPNWPEDDKDATRHCIVHDDRSRTHMTAKPIDCVFYTCAAPIKAKMPTKADSARWHRALAKAYPKSIERFFAILKVDKENQDSGTADVFPSAADPPGASR